MNQRKLDRQVAAAKKKAEQTIRQVYSLSNALLRADTALECFLREAHVLAASGRSDEELSEEALNDVRLVRLGPALRTQGLSALYLALLYAVVEKWEQWKFHDPAVDELLRSPFLPKLKKYRHAVFHADYFDAKELLDFGEDDSIIAWSKHLSHALHVALRDWHYNANARIEEHLLRLGW
jgi:hypothetical protein